MLSSRISGGLPLLLALCSAPQSLCVRADPECYYTASHRNYGLLGASLGQANLENPSQWIMSVQLVSQLCQLYSHSHSCRYYHDGELLNKERVGRKGGRAAWAVGTVNTAVAVFATIAHPASSWPEEEHASCTDMIHWLGSRSHHFGWRRRTHND